MKTRERTFTNLLNLLVVLHFDYLGCVQIYIGLYPFVDRGARGSILLMDLCGSSR